MIVLHFGSGKSYYFNTLTLPHTQKKNILHLGFSPFKILMKIARKKKHEKEEQTRTEPARTLFPIRVFVPL